MGLTEKQRRNWNYLVAAVQNQQGAYVNARASRYADAIVAVNKELQIADSHVVGVTAPAPGPKK